MYEAIEGGIWKGLCWREGFRWIQQHDNIEVRGYRRQGLERHVLEREPSGDTAA